MSYEVTATRKRPRTFDHLVGQDFVVSTLKNSLSSGRIAHAYLFAGPRGVGKTSAARILATALNCPDGPDPSACPDFAGSEEIHRGTAMDVIEIDGASNTSVNDVRAIKDEVLFAPNSSRYKIYIIDEVHMLSNSAFNALLKTIEEPPSYIVFIFATTEIHKVPATIRSRCQQFNFRLIPLDTIAGLIQEAAADMNLTADEDAVTWIAKESTGSLRDAYTLFDQIVAFSEGHIQLETIHRKLGLFGLERLNALAENLAAGDAHEALTLVQEGILSGISVERMAQELADYYRSLLLIANGIDRPSVLGMSPDRFPSAVRDAYTISQLEYANEMLLKLYRDLRYTVDQRFELELVVSRLADLQQFVYPEELVQRLETIRRQIAGEVAIPSEAGAGRNDTDAALTNTTTATTTPPSQVASANDQQAASQDAVEPDTGAHPTNAAAPPDPEVPPDSRLQSTDGGAQPEAGLQPAEIGSQPTDEGAQLETESQPDPEAPPTEAGTQQTDGGTEPTDTGTQTANVAINGFSPDQIASVIDGFRTRRINVASMLEQAVSWNYDGTTVHLVFPTEYLSNHANEEREILRDVLAEQTGNPSIRLQIRSVGAIGEDGEGSAAVDEKTDMVRRIFRGEIVENET